MRRVSSKSHRPSSAGAGANGRQAFATTVSVRRRREVGAAASRSTQHSRTQALYTVSAQSAHLVRTPPKRGMLVVG